MSGQIEVRYSLRLIVAAFGLFAISIAYLLRAQDPAEPILISHLTLYVGEPLLSQGGTVVVGSIPMPVEEWRALTGENPSGLDEGNEKRPRLSQNDRLFGAFVYGPVSYVEMYYPEGGTFGFNLVPDFRIEAPQRLMTERMLIGSGGWHDWENDVRHHWPDVSTIYVDGLKASKGNSRLIRMAGIDILNLYPPVQRFSGAIVYTPTVDQITEGTFGEYE